MPVEYELNPGLQELVDQVVQNQDYTEFQQIRNHELIIKSCLKIKLGEDEEPVRPEGEIAEVKKVGALHQAFIECDFIVVLDYYAFLNFNDNLKKAAIHKALMKIKIKESESGRISYGTRKPDVQEFQATIVRFGAWSESLSSFREALLAAGEAAGQQMVEQLAGTGSGSTN